MSTADLELILTTMIRPSAVIIDTIPEFMC